MTGKYKLRYRSEPTMVTEKSTQKTTRHVKYFSTEYDDEYIGAVATIYDADNKNKIVVYGPDEAVLDCDAETAVEGRQFLVDRFEYAKQQERNLLTKKTGTDFWSPKKIKTLLNIGAGLAGTEGFSNDEMDVIRRYNERLVSHFSIDESQKAFLSEFEENHGGFIEESVAVG